MKKIFWGTFLGLLSFNLTLGETHAIDLLPAFIGWYLVLLGLNELPDSDAKARIRNPLYAEIAVSAVCWILAAVTGPSAGFTLVSLAELVLKLIVLRRLIDVIQDVGLAYSCPMPIDGMKRAWTIFAFCCVFTGIGSLGVGSMAVLAIFAPIAALMQLAVVAALFGILAIAMICCVIWLLVLIHRAEQAYSIAVNSPPL